LIGRPITTVNNLLIGTMYIEHVGTMTVKNCQTGMLCPVEFKAAGWGNSGKHEVTGRVLEDGKTLVATLQGKWSDQLTYKMLKSVNSTSKMASKE
jgi:hypothetical protein